MKKEIKDREKQHKKKVQRAIFWTILLKQNEAVTRSFSKYQTKRDKIARHVREFSAKFKLYFKYIRFIRRKAGTLDERNRLLVKQ